MWKHHTCIVKEREWRSCACVYGWYNKLKKNKGNLGWKVWKRSLCSVCILRYFPKSYTTINIWGQWVVVFHTVNSNTKETEAGGPLSSRTAWSTKWVLAQPGKHRETLFFFLLRNNISKCPCVLWPMVDRTVWIKEKPLTWVLPEEPLSLAPPGVSLPQLARQQSATPACAPGPASECFPAATLSVQPKGSCY